MKSLKKFLKRVAIVLVVLAGFVFVGWMFWQSLKVPSVQTVIMGGSATSSLEALIEEKTEEQMHNPDFIAQMRAEARQDAVLAIYNKAQMELVDGAAAKPLK